MLACGRLGYPDICSSQLAAIKSFLQEGTFLFACRRLAFPDSCASLSNVEPIDASAELSSRLRTGVTGNSVARKYCRGDNISKVNVATIFPKEILSLPGNSVAHIKHAYFVSNCDMIELEFTHAPDAFRLF